jgi:hypothetical protein
MQTRLRRRPVNKGMTFSAAPSGLPARLAGRFELVQAGNR